MYTNVFRFAAIAIASTCVLLVGPVANAQSAPSCSIWAESVGFGYGTLHWTVTSDASNASIDNGIGSVSLSGSQYVSGLTSDRTYTMTVYGLSGRSSTCQTTVYGNGYQNNQQKPSCSISLSNMNYGGQYSGQSAMLSWTSSNATTASISPSVGSVSLNGSQAVYPSLNQIYTMTVNGQGGTNTCETRASYVPQTNSSGNLNCTITASPVSIQNGASAYLTWSAYGAQRAWLSDGIGTVSVNGSLSVRPESSRVYTLTITDLTGRTNTCQAVVSVAGSEVSLSQIPYTGDFGPLGTALSWLAVTLLAGAGAVMAMRRIAI